jgi:hypothetical protein
MWTNVYAQLHAVTSKKSIETNATQSYTLNSRNYNGVLYLMKFWKQWSGPRSVNIVDEFSNSVMKCLTLYEVKLNNLLGFFLVFY